MAGHIDYTIESSSTAVSTISSNKVKGLVVMSDKRVTVLPNVPAASETGFPKLRYEIWNMVLVPKGVPLEVATKLNTALSKVLAEPAMQAKYVQMGLTVPTSDHRSLSGSAKLLSDEVARWRKLLADAGIEP